MPTTPAWEAAKNGPSNDLNAVNHASQVTQFLGTHQSKFIYDGTVIFEQLTGTGLFNLSNSSSPAFDISQTFTMPVGQTTIGRVSLPLIIKGTGSDFTLSLYPDDGTGNPNTANLLARTLVPAEWCSSFGAGFGLSAGGPLATPKQNTYYGVNNITLVKWGGPTGNASGVAQNPAVVTSGNYLIIAGGSNPNPVSTVNTIEYLGNNMLSNGIAQPSLPVATLNGILAVTNGSVVYAGGYDNVNVLSNVWVASWDSDQGIIGSWSVQPPLPVPTWFAASASYGNVVYMIGGQDSAANVLSTVYMAQVNNGQIASWVPCPSLPVAVRQPIATVIGNWLIVAGGKTTSGPNGATSNVWLSRINSDGTLGVWQSGPPLPQSMWAYAEGWDQVTLGNALTIVDGYALDSPSSVGTNYIQTLTVSEAGVADNWTTATWYEGGVELMAAFPEGNDTWFVVNPNISQSRFNYSTFTPVPQISVPLPASGLTPGNKYHLVYQQKSSSAPAVNNVTLIQTNVPTSTPPTLRANRHQNNWAPLNLGNSLSIPLVVYNQDRVGKIIHTWSDPSSTGSSYTSNQGQQTSTLLYDRQGELMGLGECTLQPNEPLNSNPTFTSGVSPWTSSGGTITQSSAQTHGGFPFSGLLTPDGTSAVALAQSERFPVNPGTALTNPSQWYLATGWLYSPTGYSSVSLSVNWYDPQGTLISTSSSVVSLAAATWTNFVDFYLPPATAAYASLVPTESGTPPVTATLYLSNILLVSAPERVTSVSGTYQIDYPSTGYPQPVEGITQIT